MAARALEGLYAVELTFQTLLPSYGWLIGTFSLFMCSGNFK